MFVTALTQALMLISWIQNITCWEQCWCPSLKSWLCIRQALGGLAYQAFYQRILSASSYTQAQVTCFASSAFCLVLGIPSVLVGAVAASTGTLKSVSILVISLSPKKSFPLSIVWSIYLTFVRPDQKTQFICLAITIQTLILPLQTGTPPPMACPPHTIVARQAQSCPLPCSFSHPHTYP